MNRSRICGAGRRSRAANGRCDAAHPRSWTVLLPKETNMTDQKKKGDFDQWQRNDIGGNKKAHRKGPSNSRTGSKQNAGHGGHP